MRILFRRQRQQEDHPQHDRVAVFIGPDRHELKLSGELIMSDDEWQTLERWWDSVGGSDGGHPDLNFIVEDRMGTPAP